MTKEGRARREHPPRASFPWSLPLSPNIQPKEGSSGTRVTDAGAVWESGRGLDADREIENEITRESIHYRQVLPATILKFIRIFTVSIHLSFLHIVSGGTSLKIRDPQRD